MTQKAMVMLGTDDHEMQRVRTLLSLLPNKPEQSCLDIGCGDGRITEQLSGHIVIGCDTDLASLDAAKSRCGGDRFAFLHRSMFDLYDDNLKKRFDCVVISDVLYRENIGDAAVSVRLAVDFVTAPGGTAVLFHRDASCLRLHFNLVHRDVYEYTAVRLKRE